MRRRTEIVSFRANEELLKELDEVRGEFEISRGEWVRGLVAQNLFHKREEELSYRLQCVEEELKQQRCATEFNKLLLKHTLYTLLTVGNKFSAEDAKKSVHKTLANAQKEAAQLVLTNSDGRL